MEIWINPACSKCRTAKSELDAAGIEYTERRYLDDPPSAAELETVLARLGLEPWDITRDKETAELGQTPARDAAHRAEWVDLLADNPRIIQRPIITAAESEGPEGGAWAVIARDPATLGQVTTRASAE